MGLSQVTLAQRALPRHRADGAPLTPAEGGPEVHKREDLCAVLVVAARAPSLDADALAMGLTWETWAAAT